MCTQSFILEAREKEKVLGGSTVQLLEDLLKACCRYKLHSYSHFKLNSNYVPYKNQFLFTKSLCFILIILIMQLIFIHLPGWLTTGHQISAWNQ